MDQNTKHAKDGSQFNGRPFGKSCAIIEIAAIGAMHDHHSLIGGGFFVLREEKQPWSELSPSCSECFTDRIVTSTMVPGIVGGCRVDVCDRQRSAAFHNHNLT